MIGSPISNQGLASIGDLFDYPEESMVERARGALEESKTWPSEVRHQLEAFTEAIAELDLGAFQELHSRTFSLAPTCIPYAGVYLFGEGSFKRGNLLAALKERFESARFDAGTELADHVGVLLRFAAMLTEAEVDDLREWLLAKPIVAMSGALSSSENPYRFLVDAVRLIVAPQGVSLEVQQAVSVHAKSAMLDSCAPSTRSVSPC